MFSLATRTHVAELSGLEITDFLATCDDEAFRRWWPGTHFHGTGTGNLARAVLACGYRVIGVEPSAEMRSRAAHVPGLEVRRGDFLSLPVANASAAAVVSIYAFHHLRDDEKGVALRGLGRALDEDGRIVLGDAMFVDEAARDEICRAAERAGQARLLEDLRTEHYPTIPVLDRAFRSAGFRARFGRLNRYVWLVEAERA